jgi:hypothetical protein
VLASRFSNANEVTDAVLIAIESVLFSGTVLLSISPLRRLRQVVAFIATIALTSLVTHFLLFMWAWYAAEAGSDSWPAIPILIMVAASATALATGVFLVRSLLSAQFLATATLGALPAVIPIALTVCLPAFRGDEWMLDQTKLLWVTSYFTVLWLNRHRIAATQFRLLPKH